MARLRLSIEQLEVEKAIEEVVAMDSNDPQAIEIDAIAKAEDLKESEIKQEENSDVDSNTGDETTDDDSEDTEDDNSVTEGTTDSDDSLEDVATSLENYVIISNKAMESVNDLQRLQTITEFSKRSVGGLNPSNVVMLNKVLSIQCKLTGLPVTSLAKEDFNSISDKARYTNVGIKSIINKIYEIIKAIINGIRYAIIWILKAIDIYTVKSREALEEVSNYEKALQATTNDTPKETIIKSNLATSILDSNDPSHNKADNVISVCKHTNKALSDITGYVKETTPKTIKYVLSFLDEMEKQQSTVEEEIALQSNGRIENIYDSKIPYGLVEGDVPGYEKPADGIKRYRTNKLAKGKIIVAELAISKQGSNKNIFSNKITLSEDPEYKENTEVEVMTKAQAQTLFQEIRQSIKILEDMTKDMSMIRISLDKLSVKAKILLNRVNSETDMEVQKILNTKSTIFGKLVTTSNNMNLAVINKTSSYMNSYIQALLAYSKLCVKQYL
jgi:hypothetical protein